MDAYLDIETTGLSARLGQITVIGIAVDRGGVLEHTQLYDGALARDSLGDALEGVTRLYTYNGKRFDLPFIYAYLGMDLERSFRHQDLMFDCWRCGLYGGLKAVEMRLGIARLTEGVDGYQAVLLWRRYANFGDAAALDLLLRYNREDVANLKELRHRLRGYGSARNDLSSSRRSPRNT